MKIQLSFESNAEFATGLLIQAIKSFARDCMAEAVAASNDEVAGYYAHEAFSLALICNTISVK